VSDGNKVDITLKGLTSLFRYSKFDPDLSIHMELTQKENPHSL